MEIKFNMQTEYQRAMKLRRKEFPYEVFVQERKEQAKVFFDTYFDSYGPVLDTDLIEFTMDTNTGVSGYFINPENKYKMRYISQISIENRLSNKVPYFLLPEYSTIVAAGSYPLLNRSIFEMATQEASFLFMGGVYGSIRDPYFLRQVQSYEKLVDQLMTYYRLPEPILERVHYAPDKQFVYVNYMQDIVIPSPKHLRYLS